MMSSSRRRGEPNTKLHMDRQPTIARITDPSLPAGKRREIDNVMKKARANTNQYWDKKLLEAEEKDPNRWRHTGYKKMYVQGESSSGESDRDNGANFRYNGGGGPSGNGPLPPPGRYGGRSRSRSHTRMRKSPPMSPGMRRRSPHSMSLDGMRRRMSPQPYEAGPRGRPRSPRGPPRSPSDMGRRPMGGRPRSPPEPIRRRASRSPIGARRRSPPNMSGGMSPGNRRRSPMRNAMPHADKRGGQILPRSRRPPSPPPKNAGRSRSRSRSNSRSSSSVSSCSNESCSMCSPGQSHRHHSRSRSMQRARGIPPGGPRSPPAKDARGPPPYRAGIAVAAANHVPSRMHGRPTTPPPPRVAEKYRERDDKAHRPAAAHERMNRGASAEAHAKAVRTNRHSPPLEDPRLKTRPPEPQEPTSSTTSIVPAKKKKKEKELRARIKVEGEKRRKHKSSSESDDSGGSDSDSSLPTFTATTRLTLSERFGKMAQWSIDRSNMENMRITKDSTGGALKVRIEEGLTPPSRRYSYSPAPAGHFPEELATSAPVGTTLSWDDVRVRYEYYKNRGYLRDLDLKDYIKWEEWWYKYQEWVKQERYYEFWERQQMRRRGGGMGGRKKLPIAQRLN